MTEGLYLPYYGVCQKNSVEVPPMLNTDQRVKILREAKPDSWIAFSSDESQVVAYGESYDEVIERAEKAGEKEPVIVKTPESWCPRVL